MWIIDVCSCTSLFPSLDIHITSPGNEDGGNKSTWAPILYTARGKRCEPYLTTKDPTQNLNVKFIASIATGDDAPHAKRHPWGVRRLVLPPRMDFTLLFIECHCVFLHFALSSLLVKNPLHAGAVAIRLFRRPDRLCSWESNAST